MTTIKDIYQWYQIEPTKCPKKPNGLTPLQSLEWEEQNSISVNKFLNEIKSRSFQGELLIDAPASIVNISRNNITAVAKYYAKDQLRYVPSSDSLPPVYCAEYEILYDESLYETVRLIHGSDMVSLEGEILKSEPGILKITYEGIPSCKIQLKLNKIRVIDKHILCDILLDFRIKNKDNKNRTSSIGTGILGGIIGLIVGSILGGILNFVITLFANQNTNQTDSRSHIVMMILMASCGVLGYYYGFIAKRDN